MTQAESLLYFRVMALSLLLICKVGARRLTSVSGSVVRVIAGAVMMSSAEAGLAPGLAVKEATSP